MSKLYKGMLNLTKCNNKEYLKKSKAGDTIIYFDMWINEQPDQYGQTVSIQISQTKEQRESGKIFIGNAKPHEFQKQSPQSQSQGQSEDLPF